MIGVEEHWPEKWRYETDYGGGVENINGLKLRLKIEELRWKFFKFGAVGSDRFIVVNRKEKTVHRHQVSCDRF
ncbi:hypothetical protein L6452_08114 [Arctium lappa]|uniref:Uncharacterized protein n=1 Tax=Arctium lappa TaxID=4217 RepID=A0ACB9DGV2_ARCLA|nr:hypothetical protein L6452_08114 [Arctium lappa]